MEFHAPGVVTQAGLCRNVFLLQLDQRHKTVLFLVLFHLIMLHLLELGLLLGRQNGVDLFI